MTILDSYRLDNEWAFVTGANGKLGPVWIETLLEAGAHVVGLDLKLKPLSQPLSKLLKNYSDQLTVVQGDVTDKKSLLNIRKKLSSKKIFISILVNNAGLDQPPTKKVRSYHLYDVPSRQGLETLEVNVIGAFHCIQVFGKAMIKKRKGSVVNIGSMYGRVTPDSHMYDHIPMTPPFLKPPMYGPSKAALSNLTKYFSAHWGPFQVRFNTLVPGAVEGGQDKIFKSKMRRRIPLKRLASPEDLKGAMLFLASDASRYVTGTDLVVDGGYTIW